MRSSSIPDSKKQAEYTGPGLSLEDIFSGKQKVVCINGSQYSRIKQQGRHTVSVSSCGLAALNCARVAFRCLSSSLNSHESPPINLQLGAFLNKESYEEILAICELWTSATHLDVEDLLVLPIFQSSCQLAKTAYQTADYAGFYKFLSSLELQFNEHRILAIAITRPPEIVLCLRIIMSPTRTLFAVFDSHPRPLHPNGAAFVMNSSVEATAAYLGELLAIDSSLLSDAAMQWQAQLLSHFVGHVLTPKILKIDLDIYSILYEATKTILRLRSELGETKAHIQSAEVETEFLRAQVEELSKELEEEIRLTATQPALSLPKSSRNPIAAKRDHSSIDPHELQTIYDAEDLSLTSERQELLHKYSTFQCGICLENCPRDYLCQLAACEAHKYCRECLTSYVKNSIGTRQYPIPCPSCSAEGTRDRTVDFDLIGTLGLSAAEVNIFQELQLATHSILVHCRKCRQGIFIDRQEYTAATTLSCPLPRCDHLWCKLCQQSIPITRPVHSCDGSSELNDLMEREGWRHCPGCKTPIQRESGCNHMTCLSPGCNTHFCYECGSFIVHSVMRAEIKEAVTVHYRHCRLFEH